MCHLIDWFTVLGWRAPTRNASQEQVVVSREFIRGLAGSVGRASMAAGHAAMIARRAEAAFIDRLA